MATSVIPYKVLSLSWMRRKGSLGREDPAGKPYMDFIWFMKWLYCNGNPLVLMGFCIYDASVIPSLVIKRSTNLVFCGSIGQYRQCSYSRGGGHFHNQGIHGRGWEYRCAAFKSLPDGSLCIVIMYSHVLFYCVKICHNNQVREWHGIKNKNNAVLV